MNSPVQETAHSDDLARRVLRSLPLYVNFRRWHREGFARAVSRYSLWTQILKTPPVHTARVSEDNRVEVHLLCYERDYLTAMWSLKSFYWQSKANYPLAIHIHGPLPGIAYRRLAKHFPEARILTYRSASATAGKMLDERNLRRLREWRGSSGFMLKLTDFHLLNQGRVLLALDSDLLFFRPPSEILAAAEAASQSDTITIQRDIESTYNIDAAHARERWGIDLPGQVNTGVIICRQDGSLLEQCEQWLGDPAIARPTGWIEQTLYAMLAASRVCYLPDTYLVSREPSVDLSSVTMRHYAGDTRRLLTEEGMPYMVRLGLPNS